MDTKDTLGIALAYMHLVAMGATFQLIFGQPPATLSRYLADGLCILEVVLARMPEARIAWPTHEEMQEWAALVERWQPALKGCFAFVDGLNLKINEPSDPLEQNAYYNGWKCDCFESNLFLFNPLGEIIWAHINAPGCEHDSTLARTLYTKMEGLPDGMRIAADCAFTATGLAQYHIVKPLTKSQLQAYGSDRNVTVQQLCSIIRQHRTAVSIQQAAEWGMGTFQRVWGRMQLRLPACKRKRLHIIRLGVSLHNLRARLVGLNQTRTVFAPEYQGAQYERYRYTYFQTARDRVFDFV